MFEDLITIPRIIDCGFGFVFLNILSFILILITFRLIFIKNMLEMIIIMSVFSLIISLCYLMLDAPDVAMTEAALGSCLSTCVLLNFVRKLQKNSENKVEIIKIEIGKSHTLILPSILCVLFAAILILISSDLSEYGSSGVIDSGSVSQYYLEHTKDDLGIKSFVAGILASYRGYDTLGETSVILIAALSVSLILSDKERK